MKQQKYITLNTEHTAHISKMIDLHNKDKQYELEISFRNLSYVNYLRIIEYYINLVDENKITTVDSLDINILLDDGNTYRISMHDQTDIETFIKKYEKSNIITVAKYLITINPSDTVDIQFKNRGEADRLYVEDFDSVFKATKEVVVEKTTAKPKLNGKEKILYRYKQRVSFAINNDIRIDMTDVKSANMIRELSHHHVTYEMEIEFIRKKVDYDKMMEEFYRVLCIVQDTDVPISKTESTEVLDMYKNLLKIKQAQYLDTRNVISIENQHIVKYIPNNYAVTDKADGERYFLFSTETAVYLLSVNLIVRKTSLVVANKKYHNMILDGELIVSEQKKLLMLFDVIYALDTDYRFNTKYTLINRIGILTDIVSNGFQHHSQFITFTDYTTKHTDMDPIKIREYYTEELKRYWTQFKESNTESGLVISRKLYFVPYGIDPSEVFMYADLIYKLYVYQSLPPYQLDGIIYTPINSPYMIKANYENLDAVPLEYKWKNPDKNSIDFYIKFELDEEGSEAVFYDKAGTVRAYKICKLYVGLLRGAHERPIPFKINGVEQRANIYLTDGEARDRENRIIETDAVEFILDINNAAAGINDAYKWIPLHTRYDKTESVFKYQKKFGNNVSIANRIWKTIVNPISEEIIASLANAATY